MELVINILIIAVRELNTMQLIIKKKLNIMQISDTDLETNISDYRTRKENLC